MNVINPIKPETPAISAQEMERRRKAVARATAHNRIEGLRHSPQADKALEAFIRGEIDVQDLMPRMKAGLDLG